MEAIIKIQPLISLFISLATLISVVIVVYKFSNDPDVKAREEIKLINQRCSMLHGSIDGEISLIKNNHLAHIEKDLAKQSEQIAIIMTILDERLPKNK